MDKKCLNEILKPNDIQILRKHLLDKATFLEGKIERASGEYSDYAVVLRHFIDMDAAYSFTERIILDYINTLSEKNENLIFLLNSSNKKITEKYGKSAKKYLKLKNDISDVLDVKSFKMPFFDGDKLDSEKIKEIKDLKYKLVNSCMQNMHNYVSGARDTRRYALSLINKMDNSLTISFTDAQELYFLAERILRESPNLSNEEKDIYDNIMKKLKEYYEIIGDDEKEE